MIAKHGGDVYGNRGVVLYFSVNINPLGTPDFIKKAMASSLDDVSRYPDTRCRKLRSAAAAWYRVSEDTLIFGNGAAELIFLAVHALRPKRAIITAPSFLEYETALAAFDVPADFFPLKKEEGFHLPADRFLSFLEEKKPEMIFLCNPANPTGVLTERAEMEKILDFCETRGIFAVVDECFLEFLDGTGTAFGFRLCPCREKGASCSPGHHEDLCSAGNPPGIRVPFGCGREGADGSRETALERLCDGAGGRSGGFRA